MLELLTSWIIAGSHPLYYVMGTDRTVTKSGSASGSIQAKTTNMMTMRQISEQPINLDFEVPQMTLNE